MPRYRIKKTSNAEQLVVTLGDGSSRVYSAAELAQGVEAEGLEALALAAHPDLTDRPLPQESTPPRPEAKDTKENKG